MLIDHDHNLILNHRWTTQLVEITFQVWKFSATRIVEITGPGYGPDILNAAVNKVIDRLPRDEDGDLYIELAHNSETMIHHDEINRGIQWVHEMITCVRIVDIKEADKTDPVIQSKHHESYWIFADDIIEDDDVDIAASIRECHD